MREQRLNTVYALFVILTVLVNYASYISKVIFTNVVEEAISISPTNATTTTVNHTATVVEVSVTTVVQHVRPEFPRYNGESVVIVLKKGYGRFGNQLWQYASTMGIYQRASNATQRSTHICLLRQNAFQEIRQRLAGPFPPKCPRKIIQRVQHQVEGAFGKLTEFPVDCGQSAAPCVWTFDHYLQSYRYFAGSESIIRSAYQPNEALQEQVDRVWSDQFFNTTKAMVPIGLHVRRGDVISEDTVHMNNVPLSYYSGAMAFLRERYPTAHFFLASDDKAWCRNQTVLSHPSVTYLPSDLDPIVEWAVLATKCQHVIMGVGTYGWWAAFQSGGDVVYYKYPLKPEHPRNMGKFAMNDMYPKKWIGME